MLPVVCYMTLDQWSDIITITITIIIIKAIYKAQDRQRATSALCQQRKCLLSKQKGVQLCSKSLNKDISWLERCR